MHRRLFVHLGVVWVFLAGLAVGQPARSDTGVASDGTGAFASKTDGMVSTVEGYLQAKDYRGAEQAAKELTEKSPDYLKAWMLLGYTQTLNEKYAEANVAYDHALELGANRRAILMRKAYNFARLKQYDPARQAYRSILEDDPNDVEAMEQLGRLESADGHYDDASFYYRRVLDRDPKNAAVIEALAKLEAKRGSGNEAKRLLEATLELDPENVDALSKLGILLIKEKDYQSAITPLEKLVRLEPRDAKAHHNLGVAYFQAGQKAKAAHVLETMRELNGSMDGLYGPLADAYMEEGSSPKALDVIHEGLEAGSQEAWLYSLWGKILEKQGQYDAAIGKFQLAVRTGQSPWSEYARKQIARQEKLIQRASLIQQQGMR